jgi:integrase
VAKRTGKVGGLKTVGSERVVPLSPEARGKLDAWRAAGRGEGPVFPTSTGRHWRSDEWRRRVWRPLSAAAGLSGWPPYSLRHTGPAYLLSAGASLVAVAARMGHTTPALVLKNYRHVLPDDQGRLTDLFTRMTTG